MLLLLRNLLLLSLSLHSRYDVSWVDNILILKEELKIVRVVCALQPVPEETHVHIVKNVEQVAVIHELTQVTNQV